MTTLHEATFGRTLDEIVARFAQGDQAGTKVEAWLFEDEPSRGAAEARLAEAGVEARLRCAYKPLVHAVLEEIDLSGAASVEIRYPVHPDAPERRFLLEAYPLAAMLGTVPVSFRPRSDAALRYELRVLDGGGTTRTIDVEAPNRVRRDHTGETVLAPTGWLRIRHGDGTTEDGPLETDVERLFAAAIEAIGARDWETAEPYFEELRIEARLPFSDRPLGVGDEAISLAEALHEDLYFSGLELFHARSGRPAGDRGLQPGRIVPVISVGPGDPTLSIALRAHSAEIHAAPRQDLDTASEPIGFADIDAALETFGSAALVAETPCGRRVNGRYREGTDTLVVVSGGQHANETTGVVGALRAGLRLAARPGAHVALLPLENPDGYALHQELRRGQPRHMHHAARYTALGDDLEYRGREPLFEKAARRDMLARGSGALHVNLHGYPAHEWTRPLTGYVPRGFALWTVPKGFFLIVRHRAGWAEAAEALVARVTADLAAVPGLLALNERQIRLYEIHAGDIGFRMVGGFPVSITEDERHDVPVTLITEFPDETIYGDAFRLGHEAQMCTVLSAYDAWQAIGAPERKTPTA